IAKASTNPITHSEPVADFKRARSICDATDGRFHNSERNRFHRSEGGMEGGREGGVAFLTSSPSATVGDPCAVVIGALMDSPPVAAGNDGIGLFVWPFSNCSSRRSKAPASTNGCVRRKLYS